MLQKSESGKLKSTAQAPFKIKDNRYNFLYIFAAFAPKDGVVYVEQLMEALGELTNVFVYLVISNSDGKQFLHSRKLNAFFVGNYVV